VSSNAALESAQWVGELIHARTNVSPKRLVAPGPDAAQLQTILEAACAAPDHGRLRPWRLVLVPTDKRPLLAQAFEAALCERDPHSTPEQREMAREKAFRAPVLVLAVVRLGTQADAAAEAGEVGEVGDASVAGTPVHDNERLLALGCAIQNVLLSAHAHGFGTGLTSGQAMHSQALRTLFALAPHEQAVCCINLGTVSKHKPRSDRPGLAGYLSAL
jgi:nitroreductase